MKKALTQDGLKAVLQCEDIREVAVSRIFDLFAAEPGIPRFTPDGSFSRDPRDDAMVVYNAARSRRPYDNKTDNPTEPADKPCPICEGKTTGIVDVAALSSGYTFINKNLFPCVYLSKTDPSEDDIITPEGKESGTGAFGLHLLQWTSTEHDRDWHNMTVPDLVVVLERLAALEEKLLLESGGLMPRTGADGRAHGFVSIIKNYGAPVGGSLTHGHQQIAFSNVMPTQIHNDAEFRRVHGVTFAEHLLKRGDEDLLVKQYEGARLVVPYFMRRPYWSMLVLEDFDKQYLHQLSKPELTAVARGWSELTRAFREIMPSMGKVFAYNALVHNGPGAGLYIEFLPFTQEDGGYERLGLWVCQERPENAAATLRKHLG